MTQAPKSAFRALASVLALSLFLPAPVHALRPNQFERPEQRAGMEERLMDSRTLDRMTQLARTLTQKYRLTLVPWEALWAGDWPQWRLLPDLDLLQFVPEDLTRLPPEAVAGFLMESIAAAVTLKPGTVEKTFENNGPFQALWRATGTPWGRQQALLSFPGMQSDFTQLDESLYSEPAEQAAQRLSQHPAFLQFLEGILYEGRRGQEISFIHDPAVKQALADTRDLRREMLRLDLEHFYEALRDHLWPVAESLLQADVARELFRKLQQEKEFRKKLQLSGEQAAQAQEGGLNLADLPEKQRRQAEQLLQDELAQMTEQAKAALDQLLAQQMADSLDELAQQMGTGILPMDLSQTQTGETQPQEPGTPAPQQLEKMHRDLKRRAQKAGDLAKQLAQDAGKITLQAQSAGESARQVEGQAEQVRHTAGQAPISNDQLQKLTDLARQLADEGTGLRREWKDFREEAQKLRRQTDQLGQTAPEQSGKLKPLTQALETQVEEGRQEAEELEKTAKRLSAQASELAQEVGQPEPQVETIRARAQEMQTRASDAAGRAGRMQTQAEQAEKTAAELAREAQALARAKTPWERINEAARKIADWADPTLKGLREKQQALAEALGRLLQKMGQLRQQTKGKPGLNKEAQALESETADFQKAAQELLKALAGLQQQQGKLGKAAGGSSAQAPKLVIVMLEGMGQAGQNAGQIQAGILLLGNKLDVLAEKLPAEARGPAREAASEAGEAAAQAQELAQGAQGAAQQALSQAQEAGIDIPPMIVIGISSAGIAPDSRFGVAGKQLMPEAPPETPAPAETSAPEKQASAPLNPDAQAQREIKFTAQEWERREKAARQVRKEVMKDRTEIVRQQLERLRQFKKARRSLISTARAHLFQSEQMSDIAREQSGLLEGELDEEELALIQTGTPYLMKEEELPDLPKRRLAILIDVSGSMLDDIDGKPTHDITKQKLSYALDLVVTLANAAHGVPNQEMEITIFSDWTISQSLGRNSVHDLMDLIQGEPKGKNLHVSRVVKRFDEPWNDAKEAEMVDLILNSRHSGTDDVRAVSEEMERMKNGADPDTDLMLWVISDGLSGGGGAMAMAKQLAGPHKVRTFAWGIGKDMKEITKTFGPYGIWVPRMDQLVKKGMFIIRRERRRPVRNWIPPAERGGNQAGLEEQEKVEQGLARLVKNTGFLAAGRAEIRDAGVRAQRFVQFSHAFGRPPKDGLQDDQELPAFAGWLAGGRMPIEPGKSLEEPSYIRAALRGVPEPEVAGLTAHWAEDSVTFFLDGEPRHRITGQDYLDLQIRYRAGGQGLFPDNTNWTRFAIDILSKESRLLPLPGEQAAVLLPYHRPNSTDQTFDVLLVDLKSGKHQKTDLHPTSGKEAFLIDPNGKWLAVGEPSQIKVVGLDGWYEIFLPTRLGEGTPDTKADPAAVSSDGQWLAAWFSDNMSEWSGIFLFDLQPDDDTEGEVRRALVISKVFDFTGPFRSGTSFSKPVADRLGGFLVLYTDEHGAQTIFRLDPHSLDLSSRNQQRIPSIKRTEPVNNLYATPLVEGLTGVSDLKVLDAGRFFVSKELAAGNAQILEFTYDAAGLEEEDGLPAEFPRWHPANDRPGAGALRFHGQGDQAWFEVDGIRIEPPKEPAIVLSDWTIEKLQAMWNTLRKPARNRNNLMLVGEAGIGKSLYSRYLWELYRAWLRGKAETIKDPAVKKQVLEYARRTQVRVITFNENLKKSDLTERMGFGETADGETGWTATDVIEGGELGDAVILSEVNRSPGGVLAELNDPLQSRQKALHDRLVRFHPNARFIAGINPPQGAVAYQSQYKGRELPGEFQTRFDKLSLDYPPEKLANRAPNPEYTKFFEHEQQVLKLYRHRRLEDGSWAVPDGIIEGLARFANLIREDARQGQAPFIVTTRALVRMVRHLDMFPDDLARITDLFFKAYWVDDSVHGDGTERHLQDVLEKIFKPAAWPAGKSWPAGREPVEMPKIEVKGAGKLKQEFLTYPHWPKDVRIPVAPGTGALVSKTGFKNSPRNRWLLEDLLKDVAIGYGEDSPLITLLNVGDAGAGKNYFMEALSKILRRNLIVLGMSQDFKVRDMLVVRWYSKGRTRWHDSMPLAYLRPEKVLAEGPPIVIWDEGNKARPGVLAAFNDLLQERRVRLASGEEFVLPPGTIIGLNMNPPRPPYEVYDLSGEFVDRFNIHRYPWLREEDEVEILSADHPDLSPGAIHQVVKAANVLRPLYRNGELYEPPDMRMTYSALGFLDQEPDQAVSLTDLILRAYKPLKDGEPEAISKALTEAHLNIQINPSPAAELASLKARLGHTDAKTRAEAAKAVLAIKQLFGMQVIPELTSAFTAETDRAARAFQAAALSKHLPNPNDTQVRAILSAALSHQASQFTKHPLSKELAYTLYAFFTSSTWEKYLEVSEAILAKPDPRLRGPLQESLGWQRLDSAGNPTPMPAALFTDPRLQHLLNWLAQPQAAGAEEQPKKRRTLGEWILLLNSRSARNRAIAAQALGKMTLKAVEGYRRLLAQVSSPDAVDDGEGIDFFVGLATQEALENARKTVIETSDQVIPALFDALEREKKPEVRKALQDTVNRLAGWIEEEEGSAGKGPLGKWAKRLYKVYENFDLFGKLGLPLDARLIPLGRREFDQNNSQAQRLVQFMQVYGGTPEGWPAEDLYLTAFTGWLITRKVSAEKFLEGETLTALKAETARRTGGPPQQAGMEESGRALDLLMQSSGFLSAGRRELAEQNTQTRRVVHFLALFGKMPAGWPENENELAVLTGWLISQDVLPDDVLDPERLARLKEDLFPKESVSPPSPAPALILPASKESGWNGLTAAQILPVLNSWLGTRTSLVRQGDFSHRYRFTAEFDPSYQAHRQPVGVRDESVRPDDPEDRRVIFTLGNHLPPQPEDLVFAIADWVGKYLGPPTDRAVLYEELWQEMVRRFPDLNQAGVEEREEEPFSTEVLTALSVAAEKGSTSAVATARLRKWMLERPAEFIQAIAQLEQVEEYWPLVEEGLDVLAALEQPGEESILHLLGLTRAIRKLAANTAWVQRGREEFRQRNSQLQRLVQFKQLFQRNPLSWPQEDDELAALAGWLSLARVEPAQMVDDPLLEKLRKKLVQAQDRYRLLRPTPPFQPGTQPKGPAWLEKTVDLKLLHDFLDKAVGLAGMRLLLYPRRESDVPGDELLGQTQGGEKLHGETLELRILSLMEWPDPHTLTHPVRISAFEAPQEERAHGIKQVVTLRPAEEDSPADQDDAEPYGFDDDIFLGGAEIDIAAGVEEQAKLEAALQRMSQNGALIAMGQEGFRLHGTTLQRLSQFISLFGRLPAGWPQETSPNELAALAGWLQQAVPADQPIESAQLAQLKQALIAFQPLPDKKSIAAHFRLARIPVIAGFLSHGNSKQDLSTLDLFFARMDEFLINHPNVTQLIISDELGGPFLNDRLAQMGVTLGGLAAAAKRDPNGVETVARPAFEEAMKAVREIDDGVHSQVMAGRMPEGMEFDPWQGKLLQHLVNKHRKGFQIRFVTEQAPFQPWWDFMLALEMEARDAGPQNLIAANLRKLASASERDRAQFEGLLVPQLSSLALQPGMDPETLAVLVPRGRMHRLRTVELLKARFPDIEVVRMEDLDAASQLNPIDRFVEEVTEMGLDPYRAPHDLMQLVEEESRRRTHERTQAGAEELSEDLRRILEKADLAEELQPAATWLESTTWISRADARAIRASISRLNAWGSTLEGPLYKALTRTGFGMATPGAVDLSRPVFELNLSSRARKTMNRLEILTLGDLVLVTPDELRESKNFGEKSLAEVERKLDAIGLHLSGRRPAQWKPDWRALGRRAIEDSPVPWVPLAIRLQGGEPADWLGDPAELERLIGKVRQFLPALSYTTILEEKELQQLRQDLARLESNSRQDGPIPLDLEETDRLLRRLTDSIHGNNVLVLGPKDLESRDALPVLVARAPGQMLKQIIFYGVGRPLTHRLRRLRPEVMLNIFEKRNPELLTSQFTSYPDGSRITTLDHDLAELLRFILKGTSIDIAELSPSDPFRLLLAALGVSEEMLNQVDMDRLEEHLARLRAA